MVLYASFIYKHNRHLLQQTIDRNLEYKDIDKIVTSRIYLKWRTLLLMLFQLHLRVDVVVGREY